MRVLPYFQSTLVNRRVPDSRRNLNSVEQAEAKNLKASEVQSTTQAGFVPVSPVIGVVHSIKSDDPAKGVRSGVVKSGSYGFYRLDGKLERIGIAQPKGVKLDLKG